MFNVPDDRCLVLLAAFAIWLIVMLVVMVSDKRHYTEGTMTALKFRGKAIWMEHFADQPSGDTTYRACIAGTTVQLVKTASGRRLSYNLSVVSDHEAATLIEQFDAISAGRQS